MPTPTDCRRCGLPYYGAAGLLCDECEREAKCKLAKYQNDSGDDSLYNVRRLRSELAEAIKQRDALAEALSYLASCGYDGPLPQYARDKAFLALANYNTTNETKRP